MSDMDLPAGETVTVKLKRPLTTADGVTHETLSFREPEVADSIAVEEMDGGPNKRSAFALSRMCGIALSDFHKLTMADFNTILAKTEHLMGNADEDGETSPS